MPPVVSFEIHFHRFLGPSGRALAPLPAFAGDGDELVALYRAMVFTRCFDARAVALQRAGQLGTYASSLGQEAIAVGLASAMRADDVLVPSFREHGAQLWRGVTPVELLLFWGGDERGNDFAVPRRDFPVSIPVGSHAPHAAGAGLALKLRGEKCAVVCVLGDGATSKGDFHEALNLAGVWRLPVVFVLSNNQWAISVPRSAQTAAETLAQKAIAAGVPGVQVDGNDVIAVRDSVGRALERARGGGGAGVVEALTYRLADHTTSDDASRYRSEADVEAARRQEPLGRLRSYLEGAGMWDADRDEKLRVECRARVEAAVHEYLATPPAPAEAIFDHLFAELPAPLAAQRAAVLREAPRHG